MQYFIQDVSRLGPAPTVSRELPVFIANLLFSALVIAVVVAVAGFGTYALFGTVFLVGYSVLRLVWAVARSSRDV